VHLEAGVQSQPSQGMNGERILVTAAQENGGDEATLRLTRLLESQGCVVQTVPADRAEADAVRRHGELCTWCPWRDPTGWPCSARSAKRTQTPGWWCCARARTSAWPSSFLRLGAFDCLEAAPDEDAVAALAERLRAAGESRLRAYTQSLQALAPGLIHELRNPLAGILGSGQILGRVIGENPCAMDYVRILRDEALRLERSLARLAEFGRLPRGGIDCGDSLQLITFLEGLLEEWRPRCLAHGITQVTRSRPRSQASGPSPAGWPSPCARS